MRYDWLGRLRWLRFRRQARKFAVGGVVPMGQFVFGDREQVIYPDGLVMCQRSLVVVPEGSTFHAMYGDELAIFNAAKPTASTPGDKP